MTLKGQDGVKDLSQKDKASTLGFSLRWDGKTLHKEVEPAAFSQLRQRLGQSHVAPSPRQDALDAIRGWVKAYAPAFEDGDVAEVLVITAQCGFREGISLSLIQKGWQDAWKRWQRCLDKAQRRYRPR
jgi:hypothetical protein